MEKAQDKNKRDKRDPEKLYNRIKEIKRDNPGFSFLQAADIANQMHQQLVQGAKD
jgi:hypothetical protein